MRAAVCTAGAIEVRDGPEPAPEPGELVLRMRGCGLCGSDILNRLPLGRLGEAVELMRRHEAVKVYVTP